MPAHDQRLHFGHEAYVGALRDRLVDHFEAGGEEPALVAGLFGEWGCGKTAWLRRLEVLFEKDLEKAEAGNADAITVPVFFNAWRFEKEDHLIVPLLKTAQERLGAYEGDGGGMGAWLGDRSRALGAAVVAVAHGLKGKLSVPFVGGLDWDVGKTMAKAEKLSKEERERRKDAIEFYSSIYYDLVGFLQGLTGREQVQKKRSVWRRTEDNVLDRGEAKKFKKLNLLFLIDDLDRCLPEKAVEMLEAIKLFLEVEGCAFVLGVDDEVVDRGIRHRYRDYNRGGGGTPPVTGAEYLEKIIHLPVRVPPPEPVNVRAFLEQWGGRFFEKREAERGPQGEEVPVGSDSGLLDEIAPLIPPVPRKIVRAGELFALLQGISSTAEGARVRRATIALLGLLQLFTPSLFRRLRRHPEGLIIIRETWPDRAGERWESPEEMKKWLAEEEEKWTGERENPEKSEAEVRKAKNELNNLHLRWKPLAAELEAVASLRSGFNVYETLRRIQLPSPATVDRLRPYFSLLAATAAEEREGRRPEAERERRPDVKLEGIAAREEEKPQVARLRRPAEFQDAFTVRDPGAWARVIEDEGSALEGKRLPGETIGALTETAGQVRSEWDQETRANWLATLKPWVAGADLARLKEAMGWEELATALDDDNLPGKERHRTLALLDAVEPRAGVGLDAAGIPDLQWVSIPERALTFRMGASQKEDEGEVFERERPQHEVALGEPFEISRYPVTEWQFEAFARAEDRNDDRWWGPDGAWGVGDDGLQWRSERELWPEDSAGREATACPAVELSWYAAMAFCRWLSAQRGETILLPTEAQWECAVRAAAPGAGEVYPWGSGREARAALPKHANMDESGLGAPSIVGAFPGGRVILGDTVIDDLIGNVWEWCRDGWRDYANERVADPVGPLEEVALRALRGGSCWDGAWNCRSAYRFADHPGDRFVSVGFRVVRVLRQAGPPGQEQE